METVTVELCLSQSCGGRYSEPQVKEQWEVSREESERLFRPSR